MKQIQLIIVVIIIFLGIFCFTLFQPNLWKDRIETYCNSHFGKQNGIVLEIGTLKGNIFTTVSGDNTKLIYSDGSIITINDWSVKLSIWASIFNLTTIDYLRVDNLNIFSAVQDSVQNGSTNNEINIIPDTFPDILVRDFLVSGIIDVEKKIEPLSFYTRGYAKSVENILVIQLDESLVYDLTYFGEIEIIDSKLKCDADLQVLDIKINADWKSNPFQFVFSFNERNSISLKNIFYFQNFNIGDYFPSFPKIKPDFNKVSGEIYSHSDLIKTITKIKLWNEVGDTIPVELNINIQDNIVSINDAKLKYENSLINLNIILTPEGQLSGWSKIHNIKLQDWFDYHSTINLDGELYYTGFIANNKLQEWSFSADLIDTGLIPGDTLTASVSGLFNGVTFELTEPLIAVLNDQHITIDGMIDVVTNYSNLKMSVSDFLIDIFPLNNDGINIKGNLTGDIRLKGDLNSPEILLDILFEEFTTSLFSCSNYRINGHIIDPQKLKSGEIQLIFEDGKWAELDLGDGELDVVLKNGDISLRDISIISDNNFVQASGEIIQKEIISIDKILMAYNSHYLALPKPFVISIKNGDVSIEPFIIHLDDGVIEGVLDVDPDIDGRIRLSNVDGGFINNFLQENKMDLSGLIFGEIGFKKTNSDQSFSIDLTVKNGKFYKQIFNDLIIEAMIKDNIIHIENFALTSEDKTAFYFTGSIPFDRKKSKTSAVFESHFTFLDIEIMNQFYPDWLPVTGMVSGEFNLIRNSDGPVYNFNLYVDEGYYDMIYLGNIKSSGYYKDKLITFNSLSAKNSNGNITGYAKLPIDLDIDSNHIGEKVFEKEVDLRFNGKFNHMDFITEYVSSVDSLRGEVNIDLSITGPWNNLTRSGSISIEKSNLYMLLLDKPITQIDGRGKIINNILQFSDFQGMKSRQATQNNFFISGNIDLNKFFNPAYNLKITGKDIIFKSLTDEMEGNADLNLNISGKDTVSVTGNILLNELTLFKEFNTSVIAGGKSDNDRRNLVYYDLDIPIRESISLVNSQIDANLSGEIHYTKLGENDADYSGELFFKDGKFYYYSEVFLLSEGHLSFTKKGFNPILDVIATTEIEDEVIQVSFTGPLAQPTLLLSSESGFSQSDILELLTWGKRFEDQTVSYTGLGSQAAVKIEKWIDSQFDRKIMELSGLNQFGILNEVQIEGVTGILDPKNADSFSIKAGLSNKVALKYAYHRSFSLTNPSHMVGIEYKVNRYLSLVGNVDENGQVHAKYRLRYSY